MEENEHIGEWWLPKTPDAKVPGSLKTNERGRSQLTLLGELRDRGRPGGDIAREAAVACPRVLGQVGNHAFTLEGGIRVRHGAGLLGGIPSEEITFGQTFGGVWFPDGRRSSSTA